MTENQKFFECEGCNVVWDTVDGLQRVYFEFEDGTEDLILETKDYKEAENTYTNTLEYMS